MVSSRSTRSGDRALLLYADSESNADQLYFGRFKVPDPFIAMQIRGRRIGVFTSLEYGRALKESKFDDVLAYEDWQQQARKRLGVTTAGAPEVITALARVNRVRVFRVADNFPLGLAQQLARHGIRCEPAGGMLFAEREVKQEEEARAIMAGNRCSAHGLAAAEDLLRRSEIRRGRLWLDGKPLTSERVQEAIAIACLRHGGHAINTIVAGGDEACDPHCRGSGPLRANELIIVDIFPRMSDSGYFGDMTRTFLRGTPSDEQARLVATVRRGQQIGLRAIRANGSGQKVHQAIERSFTEAGYQTKRSENGWVGFIHSTGHGVGLEIHEPPRVSRVEQTLRRGTVVTVEPGLYYPGLGGCRIEDVVQVMDGPVRMLSKFHYDWVL